MQPYYTSRFMQQNEILKKTAHIALKISSKGCLNDEHILKV